MERMPKTLMERLLKVKTLMERGEDGEAIAAAYLLEQQLKKHGLTMADLDAEERYDVEFSYFTNEEKRLICQCYIKARDVKRLEYQYYKGKRRMIFQLTEMEEVLMRDLLKFHKKQWRRELVKGLRNLMTAYIHKHNIFPDTPSEGSGKRASRRDMAQIFGMMDGMEDKGYVKRLNG